MEKIAEVTFRLWGWDIVPTKAEYEVEVVDDSFSGDFIISRAWPLFFQMGVVPANKDIQDKLIIMVAEVHNEILAGREPILSKEMVFSKEDEKVIAEFQIELVIMRESLLLVPLHSKMDDLLTPDLAMVFLLPWTYGLVLTSLPTNLQAQLGFFFNYAVEKWRRNGIPSMQNIMLGESTWDFSDLQKMDFEFAEWVPSYTPLGKYED